MDNTSVVKRKNIYRELLIEGILVFLSIVFGLLFEIYTRGLILQNEALRVNIIGLVFIRSFISTVVFVVGYRIFKSKFSFLYDFITAKFHYKQEPQENYPKISFFNDVFVILSVILITIPVRPILQESFIESNISGFEYAFVRYDAILSVIVLLILAVPLIFFILKYKKGTEKILHITTIGIVIIGVGLINNMPNFYARVFESRASWIIRDWNKQGTNAQKALENAKTDKEKAIAYYWLGVSENRKKNPSKAIEYQLEAIKLNPKYDAAYASLANGYLDTGQYEKSLRNAEKCVEYDPDYAWCYQALGRYYWVTGEIDLAAFNFCKAAELDKDNRELKAGCEYILEYKKLNYSP